MHSCPKTRSARVSAVSSFLTAQTRCTIIGPLSYSFVQKCTVQPLTLHPAARTASCTRCPHIPCPPKLGSSAGWMFITRFSYFWGIFHRHSQPPCTTRSTFAASSSSSIRLLNSLMSGWSFLRTALTSSPAFFAFSTPDTVERELITTATSAFSLPVLIYSRIFINVVPPPLMSTPRRTFFLFGSADSSFASTSLSRFKAWFTSLSASLFFSLAMCRTLQLSNSLISAVACL